MSLDHIEHIYFLGIGGIGMSALARYCKSAGLQVSGYDRSSTPLTRQLEEEGMLVHYEDKLDLVPVQVRDLSRKEHTLVVFTPAVPKNHTELNYFQQHDYQVVKRSQLLGMLTESSYCIAVAGTHGKTTTSTLIAHILKTAGIDCNAFLGGISANYNTNFLQGNGTVKGKAVVVVEADEFDRSFLTLAPDLAVITSNDPDHLDIYGEADELKKSFIDFSNKIKEGGMLFIRQGLPIIPRLSKSYQIYSIQQDANYRGINLRVENGTYHFDLEHGEMLIKDLQLGLPGWHNVENAVAASAVALQLGIAEQDLRQALESYRGAKRRFEYILRRPDFIFIDDYAHHPAEIHAFLSSVREMYPGKKLTAIFQPHLFSRTRDFAAGFSESLSLADEVILLDIYPAREQPIPGVSSAMLLDAISSKEKVLCRKEDLPALMRDRHPEVLLTIGAGDIDQLVQPLKKLYE